MSDESTEQAHYVKQLRARFRKEEFDCWFKRRRGSKNDIIFFRELWSYRGDLSVDRPVPDSEFSRDPIYQLLTVKGRCELQCRMFPGTPRPGNIATALLSETLDDYAKHEVGGVSPYTASGLLTPEPYYVFYYEGIGPQMIVPEPIAFRDSRSRRWQRRHTQLWHVLAWVFKRYYNVSWSDMATLHPELKRKPHALRETVRRMVEEPIAGFYEDLAGRALDPSLYSSSLGDAPTDPDTARERMRDLKRRAYRRARIPQKHPPR